MNIKKHLQWALVILGLGCFSQAHAQRPPGMDTEAGPGYLVVSGWYKDIGVQKAYVEKVGPVIRKHGFVTAKIGLPGVNLRVIEGDWTPRPFSLMQFPSQLAVKQFWTSDAYQKDVKPIRHGQSAIDVLKLGAAFGTEPTFDAKSALLIFFVDLTDRETFLKQYVPKAPSVVARHGGKFLVSAAQSNIELLEGDYPSKSMVVLEFPTGEALKAFWNDEEYKTLSEVRKSVGKWSVVEIMPFVRQ